ncbi:MAG TPA: helix-turn-helix domain-containing protein [Acidimicrobiales bacterium]|nr:helix-turn-helix domain-containing protein [Acidimicrobiales bacterium]
MSAEEKTEARSPRSDFRQTILEATRRIIDERGLQAATTRNIAELAGCAEGTIYRHFEDKHELFLELFAGTAPEFLDLVHDLQSYVGGPPVQEALTRVGLAALRFYRAVLPFIGGGIVDPELRAQQRKRFNVVERGPLHTFDLIEDYLEAERALGRLGRSGSSSGAARALLGAAFGRAYLDVWLGAEATAREPSDEEHISAVVGTLLHGLSSEEA